MIRLSEWHENIVHHLPVITETDYPAFLYLMNTRDRPNEIPPTFAGWNERLAGRMALYPKAIRVPVRSEQFSSYCHAKSREADLNALG